MNGSKFDSSRARGQPIEFVIGQGRVIQGWDRNIVRMSRGQTARLVVPPKLAYGPRGYPPIIPPNSTLTFEIELISFFKPESQNKGANEVEEVDQGDISYYT